MNYKGFKVGDRVVCINIPLDELPALGTIKQIYEYSQLRTVPGAILDVTLDDSGTYSVRHQDLRSVEDPNDILKQLKEYKMEILKLLLSGFGVLAFFGGGFALASKLRGSALRKKFSDITNAAEVDKTQIHEIEVSVGKSEQEKDDLRKKINDLDAKPSEAPPTNTELTDFFDKMSKK